MPKLTALFLAVCFSCFGQLFMPEPLPQVEYLGGLPNWKVGVYNVDGKSVLDKPSDYFVTGSVPRGHMIIFQHVDPRPPDTSINAEKPKSPEVFYLKDNIWNESKRILEKYYNPPPIPYIFYVARDISRHNKVNVPAWKLGGIILDTKMPKGYKLKYLVGLP